MSGKKSSGAWDRTSKATDQLKPMADQLRPLAQNAGDATRRTILRTRAWAAPQVQRTGQVLQNEVAPKVGAMLSEAAQRIDPAKPKTGRWRLPVGIAAALAAGASAAAAILSSRQNKNGHAKLGAEMPPTPEDGQPGAHASMADGNGQVHTDS
jgi:hypothetical protein